MGEHGKPAFCGGETSTVRESRCATLSARLGGGGGEGGGAREGRGGDGRSGLLLTDRGGHGGRE